MLVVAQVDQQHFGGGPSTERSTDSLLTDFQVLSLLLVVQLPVDTLEAVAFLGQAKFLILGLVGISKIPV